MNHALLRNLGPWLLCLVSPMPMILAQESPSEQVETRIDFPGGEQPSRGCGGKGRRRGGPLNFEDYFVRGFRNYGRQQWDHCIDNMKRARALCGVESGTAVKFNSRDYVSYLPTLYLWAATYHCEKGDPSALLRLWRAFFSTRWNLACLEDPAWLEFQKFEQRFLEERWSGRMQRQVTDLELGLRTIRPRSARDLCRKLLTLFKDYSAGRLTLEDEPIWSELARTEGYVWPPDQAVSAGAPATREEIP